MSAKTPKDQAARERIANDLDTSFAVEAGAGTGKTTLLTDRMIRAIRTGRARLGEAVAITFTDRAANELKVRLRDKLERLLGETSGEENGRIADALAGLDTAHTSTIHSFCAEMLRERPVEAGVDPGFEIADALRSDLLFEEVWTRWLGRELDNPDSPLRHAFLAGLGAGHLKTFASFLRWNRDLQPPAEEFDIAAAVDEFVRQFVPQARALYARMQARCPSPDCSCNSRIVAAVRGSDQLDAAAPGDRFACVPTIPALGLSRPRNACKPHKDQCLRELNELEQLAGPLRGPAAHVLVCKLAEVLRGMGEEYEREKRRRAWLDFDDLLLKARDLLRDNKDVRRYFQAKYKMILVDECQDTDPLQTEIALFLAEDGARADDWRRVRIAPGKLLFVGDPKQSIYRFRRADIETYEEAKQVVAQSGELLHISQNFRSSASCVRWVNAVFGELIERPDDGAYQPEYVPLDAWRTDDAPAATVLRPPTGTDFGKIDEARAAEAAAVAAEILRMVRRGDTILDKDKGKPRPVTFADFAILFRARTSFSTYENTLGSFGVPFRAVSGRSFFARQEVAELRCVLAAAERPYDGLAVAAALRTSLLGIADDELPAATGVRFNYLRDLPADAGAVRSAFALLAGWHRLRNSASTPALVQKVLSDTKAVELFYLKPGGEQRAANLAKVIDVARAYEETPGATFGGFVRWLEELTTAGEEGESPLAEEEGEFVKLITVHKAKGLEFPVVVLADIAGDPNPRSEPVVNRREGTFDIRLGPKDLNVSTIGYADALEYEKLREEAEARRLFYVATTRARDRLIIPHFAPERMGGCLKYLLGLSDNATDEASAVAADVTAAADDLALPETRAFRVNLAGPPPKECDRLIKAREEWKEGRRKLIEAAAAHKPLRTASGLTEADHVDFGPPSADSEQGRAIGKATHAVLEQANLATGSGLDRLAEAEAVRNGVPGQAQLIKQLARNAVDSPLVKRAAEAAKVYREVPFAVSIDGTVLEGFIDLAFDDGSGLVIVDYKTDDVPEAELAAHADRYRLQVGAYALAAREVFGVLPRAAALLFLRAEREVPVRIDDELIGRVREAL